jgi:hypothetical protein
MDTTIISIEPDPTGEGLYTVRLEVDGVETSVTMEYEQLEVGSSLRWRSTDNKELTTSWGAGRIVQFNSAVRAVIAGTPPTFALKLTDELPPRTRLITMQPEQGKAQDIVDAVSAAIEEED